MKKCKVCNIIVEDEKLNYCEICGNKLVVEETNRQFCINCGTPLDLDDLYCPSCGSKVEQQTNLNEDKQMKMCPICASFVDEDCELCVNCGYNFSEILENKSSEVDVITVENEININEQYSNDNQMLSSSEYIETDSTENLESNTLELNDNVETITDNYFADTQEQIIEVSKDLESFADDSITDKVDSDEVDNQRLSSSEYIEIDSTENLESNTLELNDNVETITDNYFADTQEQIIEVSNDVESFADDSITDKIDSDEVDNQIHKFDSSNDPEQFDSLQVVKEENVRESSPEILTSERDNESEIHESSNNNFTRYCSKCGTVLNSEAIFCPECGYNQDGIKETIVMEEPKQFIQPIPKFDCPEDSEYYCPNCGFGEKYNNGFCRKCKSVLVRKNKLAFSYVEDELTKKEKRIRKNKEEQHQEELTRYHQEEQNNILKFSWYIFGLCFAGILTSLGFVIFFLMIAGIFFGKKQLKIFKYLLSPMNVHVIRNTKKYFFLNALWFILGGFIVILLFRVVQCVLCITIFGMPIARQMNKFVELFKSPFSAKIISNNEFSCTNIEKSVYSRQFLLRNIKLSILQPHVLTIKKEEKKAQRKKNWLFVLFFFIFLIGFIGLYLSYIFKLSFTEFIFDSYYFEFIDEYSTYIFLAIIGLFFAIAFYCSIGRRMVKRIVVDGYGTRNQLIEIFDKKKYYPENNRIFKAYLKLYVDYKEEIDNFIKNEQ